MTLSSSKEIIHKGHDVTKHVAIWKWNGWGFTKAWHIEKGDFVHFEIETIGQNLS